MARERNTEVKMVLKFKHSPLKTSTSAAQQLVLMKEKQSRKNGDEAIVIMAESGIKGGGGRLGRETLVNRKCAVHL